MGGLLVLPFLRAEEAEVIMRLPTSLRTKTSCQSIVKIMVVDDEREDEEVSVPVMVTV
jgi:hypothetical protein